MSALALFLRLKGNKVSGFDRHESEITDNLKTKGIKINDLSVIENCDVAVVSSAIQRDDPILKNFIQKSKKIVTRSELLKQISQDFKLRIGKLNSLVTDTVSTNSFITTHVFDYNTLFNVMSMNRDYENGSSASWTLAETENVQYGGGKTLNFVFIDHDPDWF